jgi:hypothetical protein
MTPFRNVVWCGAVVAAAVVWQPAWAHGGDCLGRLRDALIKGGYSGETECAKYHIHVGNVGVISVGDKYYRIFGLHYHWTTPGGAEHGGQRLLFFGRRGEYVGKYGVLGDERFHVVGHALVARAPRSQLVITSRGPSAWARIEGTDVDFYQ